MKPVQILEMLAKVAFKNNGGNIVHDTGEVTPGRFNDPKTKIYHQGLMGRAITAKDGDPNQHVKPELLHKMKSTGPGVATNEGTGHVSLTDLPTNETSQSTGPSPTIPDTKKTAAFRYLSSVLEKTALGAMPPMPAMPPAGAPMGNSTAPKPLGTPMGMAQQTPPKPKPGTHPGGPPDAANPHILAKAISSAVSNMADLQTSPTPAQKMPEPGQAASHGGGAVPPPAVAHNSMTHTASERPRLQALLSKLAAGVQYDAAQQPGTTPPPPAVPKPAAPGAPTGARVGANKPMGGGAPTY